MVMAVLESAKSVPSYGSLYHPRLWMLILSSITSRGGTLPPKKLSSSASRDVCSPFNCRIRMNLFPTLLIALHNSPGKSIFRHAIVNIPLLCLPRLILAIGKSRGYFDFLARERRYRALCGRAGRTYSFVSTSSFGLVHHD